MINRKYRNFFASIIVALSIVKYYAAFYNFTFVAKYIMIICLLLSTILIVDNRKNYNLIHAGFLVLASAGFVFSKNITLLYAYYLCLGVSAADFREIVKVFVIVNTILFAGYLILNVAGIHPTEYIEGRNDFGFGNPNTAFINMFIIWSGYFYLVYDRKNKLDYILLFALVFLMYTQTVTRTGLLASVLTVAAYIILKYVDVRNKKIAVLIALFPVLMTVMSLMLAFVFSDNFFLNSVLSHRPLYWGTYLKNGSNGLNLFGYASNIRDYMFTQRIPFDSGYMWTLYSQGVALYIPLIAMISYTMYRMCIEDKKAELLLMTSILIYCFAESILVDINSNISLVLIVWGVSNIRLLKGRKLKEKKL